MNVLDLFSGIGGFSLGLERAGMRTVAFCEIDPYCQRVLRRHWPDVPVYDDVRTLTAARLMADANHQRQLQQGGSLSQERRRLGDCGIDVICGGFPCQDISVAGKGAGLAGERSGLWSEYARIIGEIQPRYVIVENVAALLSRGLGDVLGDLATLGYNAEWHCIPASAVGAPHRRDRVWIVAHAERLRCPTEAQRSGDTQSDSKRQNDIAWNADQDAEYVADSRSLGRLTIPWRECDHWLIEPDVGRVANGIPQRVDRLRALGNSVVPQIPEIIGRAIMMQARTALDKDTGK